MLKRGKIKLIPKSYLYVQLSLIGYGAIVNTLVFLSQSQNIIQRISSINLNITAIWALMNLFLFSFFSFNKFENKAKIFSGYNFLINTFNFTNVFFQFISNYKIMFILSVTVKLIEFSVCIILLSRDEMKKHGKFFF